MNEREAHEMIGFGKDRPACLTFPEETPQERERRRARVLRMIERTRSFGVCPVNFDGGAENTSGLFRSVEEELQYSRDVAELLLILDEDGEVPVDLQQRLLTIKARKDKLGIPY